MRYFTDNPLERMMMQVPRQERGPDLSRPAKGHPCHGCKRYGEGCILPCYRLRAAADAGGCDGIFRLHRY